MGLFSRKHSLPASIRNISFRPPPGAPWYYWTFVVFESRGQPIKLKLSKRQAKSFVDRYTEGDTGHLTYSGKKMIDWKPSEIAQTESAGISAFVSYAHEWADDAEYIAQALKTEGITVWLDNAALQTGDRLNSKVTKAINACDYFVPLLSPEYVSSPWCIKELETAAEAAVRIIPLKVSDGDLHLPPHVRHLYDEVLGEPVFLDLRQRDPTGKLRELTKSMKQGVD